MKPGGHVDVGPHRIGWVLHRHKWGFSTRQQGRLRFFHVGPLTVLFVPDFPPSLR